MITSSPRRVCVVTGSRAEYGLLHWLIRALASDPRTEPIVVVTGSHLAPEHGMTVREIEDDGIAIAERVEILMASDTGVGTAKAMGLATMGLAETFARQKPDLVVVFGDRFEMLAAASAAMALRLPIAHIAGGQLTEGAIDDAIRHALTKMAHLHFTAIPTYAARIRQLGEAPERIFVVGSTGLDSITRETLLERAKVEERLNITLGERALLVTFHPETLSATPPERQIDELLTALANFDASALIFTQPNADPGGRAIMERLQEFAATRPRRTAVFPSLGRLCYLSTMAQVKAVVGNSSSGIIEAPSFRVATVNIGDRQKGRLRAASVIDCACEHATITTSLTRALCPEFQAALATVVNPFGDGHASERIVDILASYPLGNLLCKHFHDIPVSQ